MPKPQLQIEDRDAWGGVKVNAYGGIRVNRPRPRKTVLPPTPAPAKPFVCEVCGRSFDYRVALAGHMRSHKGRAAPAPTSPSGR